jgi:inositol phosphorylceramide mannosyltransferase catalytic subunit
VSTPKVLHQIWINGEPPPRLLEMRQTWLDLHPDWTHVLWSDDLLPPITHRALYDDPPCKPINHGQFRADLLRYDILYEHGGVYVDMDFEALTPIDDLLAPDLFATWEFQNRQIANGLMGATSGHPFIKRLIDTIPRSVTHFPDQRPARVTGPHHLTRNRNRYRPQMTIYPQTWFFPFAWNEIDTDKAKPPWPQGTRAVHHWHNQHRERGIAM